METFRYGWVWKAGVRLICKSCSRTPPLSCEVTRVYSKRRSEFNLRWVCPYCDHTNWKAPKNVKENKSMLEMHRTKSGERLFVSQMSDEHLTATITLLLNQVTQCRKALDMKVNVTKFKSALYNIQEEEISDRAGERIQEVTTKLYPYLAEAMLRGLHTLTPLIQAAFDRKAKEELFNVVTDVDELFADGDDKYALPS